jgi:AbrB family looped-hinge helix DNA binding protein
MTKVTGKFQITLPKRLVETYDIKVGDEVDLLPAGDSISLVPAHRTKADVANPRQRLLYFDRATERQRKRERTRIPGSDKDRGWTRAEIYTRGQPR